MGNRIGIKDISKGVGAPEHFMAKILQELSRRKIVQSVKGPHGGFFIDGSSKKTTLVDIVKAIDGDQLFTGCGLGLKVCSEITPCPLHDEFKIIRKRIHNMLECSAVAFNMELIKGNTHLKR